MPEGAIKSIERLLLANKELERSGNIVANLSMIAFLNWLFQNATSKGGKVKLPNAFTEKGLYMLATIIKSKQATKATLQIIETFAKVREFSNVVKSLATEESELKKQSLIKKSGQLIGDILNQEFADDTRSETTIELNLATIKIKHKIIKNKKYRVFRA
ncbi:MAG: ORF6N domain-containing protein [Nitrosopumilus sp.]|nr:ORF6N domain-containing protein [Nitrosopumilus sp.]